ncbi:MAG: methyltransferase domain-containing protein [Candidatus Omnitrophica bacterium]|nr:methyltransferase domain-containing protein [Candidatus Omnitrophota bacterium]
MKIEKELTTCQDFNNMVVQYYAEVIKLLEKHHIKTHLGFQGHPEGTISYLLVMNYLEIVRRTTEVKTQSDKVFTGSDVGKMRQYFNGLFESEIDYSKALIDMGCGGPDWKDTYWTKLPKVIGLELNYLRLLEARKVFPDEKKVELVFSPTGMTDFPDNSIPQVLSSAIITSVTPNIAQLHLRECWRILEPKGKLIIARVQTKSLKNIIKGGTFTEFNGVYGAFNQVLSKKEFCSLVDKCCPNNKWVKFKKMGFRLPLIPAQIKHDMYDWKYFKYLDAFINAVIPHMAIHFLAVIEKQ